MSKLAGYLKKTLLVVLFVSCNAFASDLGVIGKTYPIIERDLIDVIHERIEEKTKSGELDELHQGMKDRSKEYASRPPGVGLPRATEYRAIEVNPVYTLEEDIVDAEGKVLFKAGPKVNPLEIRPLTKTLCFIDGDDQEQVAWMQKYCAQEPRNKLILVNGDFELVSKKTGLRLYFDQRGYLVGRLGITALPAVVRQSGKVLYVEEFPIN